MPVVPELRLAPRLTGPWIPGRAGRAGTTDPGPPLGCPFFGRPMGRDTARAGAGKYWHESTPPQQVRTRMLVLGSTRRASNGAPGAGGPVRQGPSATTGDPMVQA